MKLGISRTERRFAIVASGALVTLGCNAILGIDEGHLVAGSAGEGGGGTDASSSGGVQNPDSGAGGKATGGSASGGKSGGGAGGASGAGGGGAGGKAGAGGAGGSAGSGGASGTGGGAAGSPAGQPFEVHCGTANCMLPGQVCCVSTATGEAHCSSACDPTSQAAFSCDGSEDCTGGSHCCNATGSANAQCANLCTGRVFCGADADCAPGQYCAPGSGSFASVFICTNAPAKTVWCGGTPCAVTSGHACCYDKATHNETCAATCGTNTIRFACDSDDDCATGSVCCESHTGLGVATGTSCVTGTSCPTDRAAVQCGGSDICKQTMANLCCMTGGGTTCGSTCTASIACGTDADCPQGQTCTVVTTAVDTSTGRRVCSAAMP